MAFLTGTPVDTGSSIGVEVVAQQRPADPFDESTLTWTQLTASSPEDWAGFYLIADVADESFVSIATGAAASEVRIATILFYDTFPMDSLIHYVPISIPAGTRLSCAVGNQNGSANAKSVQVIGVSASAMPTPLGLSVLDCGPIRLDGGGADYALPIKSAVASTNNTKTAWTEISFSGILATPNNILNGDSLDQVYDYIGVQLTKDNSGTSGDACYLVDFAYGAAASETIFLENLFVGGRGNRGDMGVQGTIIWVPWGRAAGDRISFRYQVNDVTIDDGLRVMLYGVR